MRKKKIKILHVAQAAGGVDRYIRMLLKYLDKEKFENILVCSQDFNREDYDGLVDSFEQIEMNRAIGVSDLNSIKEVRRLIKKYNPDIVYAHSSKAGAIARVADQPIIQPVITPTLRSASGQGERPRRKPRVPDAPKIKHDKMKQFYMIDMGRKM